MSSKPLAGSSVDDDFFARDALDVARDLVGCTLVRDGVAARVVETEAYKGDPASHFVTRRHTAKMMGDTYGRLYVYRIYGMHRCLNVTADRGGPGGVLFRALEPLEGADAMAARRGVTAPTDIASGPGKLFVALGLDESMRGDRILDHFAILPPAAPPRVSRGPRIGVTKAKSLPWRFWERGNPHVSR